MGIDAKGICQTDNKDVFQIAAKVEKALNNLIRSNKQGPGRYDKNNRPVDAEIVPSSEMLVLNFTLRGETRRLFLHLGCDSDSPEIPGKKLIWQVGKWGSSEEIITTVGNALKDDGPIYYDLDDCDNVGYIPASI